MKDVRIRGKINPANSKAHLQAFVGILKEYFHYTKDAKLELEELLDKYISRNNL